MDFGDDGSLIAVAGGQPLIVDAATRLLVTSLHVGEARFMTSVQFSADRRTVIATIESPAAGSTTIQRFDARNGRIIGVPRRVTRSATIVTPLSAGRQLDPLLTRIW